MDQYDKYLQDLFQNLETYKSYDSIIVTFDIDVKFWTKMRHDGQLGQLYGVDLSNRLSRAGLLDFYAAPIISDKSRATKGLKPIRAEYRRPQ